LKEKSQPHAPFGCYMPLLPVSSNHWTMGFCPVFPHVGVPNHQFIPRRALPPCSGHQHSVPTGLGLGPPPSPDSPQAGGHCQNQPRAFKLLGNFLIEKIYCCLPQPLWMK